MVYDHPFWDFSIKPDPDHSVLGHPLSIYDPSNIALPVQAPDRCVGAGAACPLSSVKVSRGVVVKKLLEPLLIHG